MRLQAKWGNRIAVRKREKAETKSGAVIPVESTPPWSVPAARIASAMAGLQPMASIATSAPATSKRVPGAVPRVPTNRLRPDAGRLPPPIPQ